MEPIGLLGSCFSVLYVCYLSFFPLQFAGEGTVASVSGIMDFSTCLGTGILIDGYGYGAMFATWAVLCGIGFLFQRRK